MEAIRYSVSQESLPAYRLASRLLDDVVEESLTQRFSNGPSLVNAIFNIDVPTCKFTRN